MKNLNKIGIACALLAVCISARAQLIGSWQGTSDEGWIDWGNQLSITNSANTNKYQFVPGAVAGFNQSLQIAQGGYNQSLAIKLENLPGGKAAFLNNTALAFTFSVPPSSASGATGGYSQLNSLVINASGLGFAGQSFSTNTWTETGSTGNDSGGQPIFYFGSSSPARSQTVVFNYSNLLSQITATTNSGYIEIIFTFNNGGGAPTNFFMNNVQLLGSAVQVPAGTFIVDDFSPAGVSTANPTNYDYYNSSQVYSTGQITNVWGDWFGSALTSATWDSTTDAGNNPTSGSLKITAEWTNANQFVAWDQAGAADYYSLNISGLQYTNFQCDVKFAPGSGTEPSPSGQSIFGHLQFGTRTPSYGQDYFASVDVPATNTGWVHVTGTLNAVADTNLLTLGGFIIHIYGPYYNANTNLSGTSTLWVDNIKFTGPSVTVTSPPPTLAMSPAVSGLRIFAGSSAQVYDREELATMDNNQSWVTATAGSPVSYSFTLLDYPQNINQTHIFLVPATTSGQANMGNAGPVNEFIEYQASNTLWMVLNPFGNGKVTASVQWKTNSPNANPTNNAVTVTNLAVGTWTLKFTSASTGTLTAPGASPVPFTIGDPNVQADFTNPCVAYFGLQPNATTGEGEYEDWAGITVSGVAGVNESENFVNETTFNANNYWATNSASAASIQPVPPGNPYWISWSLPALGYGLGAASAVNGASNTPNPWMLPEYFNFYNGVSAGGAIPGQAQQGTSEWVLVPAGCVPTVDGSQGGVPAPDAFYKLFNPALNQ